ncbi:transcobalamin-2 isoform X2 [Elgaria multicarinata webbii]
MDPRWPWVFLLLLHILFGSVQQCEIPRGNSQAIRSLNAELLKLTVAETSEELNPSIYLGLRLSDDHSLARESQYLQRLHAAFQSNASRPPSEVHYQEHPGTGRLALNLLALRAACQNMNTITGKQLVTQLKLHLEEEMKQIDNKSIAHPVTNYYQYSLGVLALCVHSKKINERVIDKLLHAEAQSKFRHIRGLSVDTEAMAGLAFACLKRATGYTPELAPKLDHVVNRLKKKILRAQTSEGAFGNIYSSPLAVQFLIATRSSREPKCANGVAALLRSLEQGGFKNSLIMSQLLPVLHGKSYLDLAGLQCNAGRDSLEVGTPSPKPRGPSQPISVRLIVENSTSHLYKQLLQVPLGASLLDILTAARKLGHKPLSFETEETLSGPLLTSMMGLKAQKGERKYWKILRAPNTSLREGIADYIPRNRENIIFRFIPW